jgi:hypothetical protein
VRGIALRISLQESNRKALVENRLSTRLEGVEECRGEPMKVTVTASHQLPPLWLKHALYLNITSFIIFTLQQPV